MQNTVQAETRVDAIPPERNLVKIILRNSLIVTLGSWILRLMNFLFTIYVIRLLGESGYGYYSTVVAFVGLFSVFFELGMSQYVERTVAQDPTRTQALFWNLVVLRLILALLGIIIILVLALAVGYEKQVVIGVLLLSSTFLMAALLTPLNSVLIANERFYIPTLSEIVGQIITIVFSLVFLMLGAGFLALLYTGFIAMPLQIALCSWAIRRSGLGPLKFQIMPSTWVIILRGGLPFGLTSLALTFNYSVDTVIMGFFFSAGVVGWYNAAYRLVFTITSIASGFWKALTPTLTRENMTNPEWVGKWVRGSMQAVALCSLPIAVGVSLTAPRIIELLYGNAFAPAALILTILIWDIPFVMFNALCGNVTAAVSLEKPASRIYLRSTLINIILNLLLIPIFGMIGAAFITVLTDGLTTIQFYILLNSRMGLNTISTRILRTILAAVLMGIVIWLTNPLHLLIVILSGITSYAALSFYLGIIDQKLIQSIMGKLKRV